MLKIVTREMMSSYLEFTFHPLSRKFREGFVEVYFGLRRY